MVSLLKVKKQWAYSADKSTSIYAAIRQIHPDQISKRNKRAAYINELEMLNVLKGAEKGMADTNVATKMHSCIKVINP